MKASLFDYQFGYIRVPTRTGKPGKMGRHFPVREESTNFEKWRPCVCLPAATKLGQGNIFTSVCQEFCPQRGEGVCLSACWDTPPPDQAPPPRSRHHHPPRTRHPPPPRSRHPPGPGTLPPGADTTTPGPDTPPRDQAPPPPGSRLQHTVNERPVRILLECILVQSMLLERIGWGYQN